MRIQKEIDNVERVKEKIATMPLTMEDAIEFHKRVVDRVEKERKEVNKELGIGDIEKDGFTGRTKNFKTSTPELKKMKLSESLFNEEVLSEDVDYETYVNNVVKKVSNENLLNIYARLSNSPDIFFTETKEYKDFHIAHEVILGRMDGLSDEEIIDKILSFKHESLKEELEDTDGWGDEIEAYIEEVFSKLENLIYEIRNCRRGVYTNCETAEELADYIHRLAEDLDECASEIRIDGDIINESLNEDDSGSNFVQQAEEEERERKREEEEKKKKEKEEEKKARLKDKLWAEKDWVAERAKAEKEGKELDLSKYSKEEQDAINQGFDDFANDETAQAQYLRKKEKEMKDAAEKEAEKAEQEKKNERKELFGYSGDKEDITKAIGNVGKAVAGVPDAIRKGLSKAGINI